MLPRFLLLPIAGVLVSPSESFTATTTTGVVRIARTSVTALDQVIGKGGMADTRDPEAYVDEDPRKSISAAPSFEEYLKQRDGAAAAAAAPAAPAAAAPSGSSSAATRADLTSKEFQLEELEDKEECETELWLNDDGTVTLGATNGPKVKEYKGDWHVLETASENDRPFRMRLTRTYDGSSYSTKSNVGDITYEVKREFWGNVEMVGGSIAVTGRMHGCTDAYNSNAYADEQSILDSELGYFTMIDSVASEGVEGERQ